MLGPELDSRLIQLLTQHARLSNSELSRRLGVSRSTIQSRIERLEQTGVIQGYTLKLNPKSDKNVVQAHVSISVAPKLQAAEPSGPPTKSPVTATRSSTSPPSPTPASGAIWSGRTR